MYILSHVNTGLPLPPLFTQIKKAFPSDEVDNATIPKKRKRYNEKQKKRRRRVKSLEFVEVIDLTNDAVPAFAGDGSKGNPIHIESDMEGDKGEGPSRAAN